VVWEEDVWVWKKKGVGKQNRRKPSFPQVFRLDLCSYAGFPETSLKREGSFVPL